MLSWQLKFIILLTMTWTLPANAKLFLNSYIQFEMPDKWTCELLDTAWICRQRISKSCEHDKKNKACLQQIKKFQEAFIILAAKEVSPLDTMASYLKHLQSPLPLKRNNGNTTQSQIIHAKGVKIGQQKWVDGMHLSSELPNYYTRYLTTIKDQIAVLVTFSAHKKYYTNHSAQFFKSIKSLKITASETSNVKKKELGSQVLSRPIQLPDNLLDDVAVIDKNSESDPTSNILFLAALVLAALGIYIWFKNRRRTDN